jgi:hypothetical protein
MNKLFWWLIILDEVLAIGLVAFLLLVPNKSGPNVLDSLFGRGAGVASILLLGVGFAYWNTRSPGVRVFLLIVAAVPLAVAATSGVIILGGPPNERLIRKYNDSRLLSFKGYSGLSTFATAIYEHDFRRVRALSPQVDINAVSAAGDYTPLKLAVERAREAEEEPEAAFRALEIVRLLLKSGARPNSGLYAACYHSTRTDLVRMLLDAGADPNNREPDGKGPPAFYGCFDSRSEAVGLENLRLLKDHGADFTLKGDWTPAIPCVASDGRWETVLYLHQFGATLREDRDGGWMAGRVADELAAAKQNQREPSDALKRVAELLKQ